MSVTEDNRSEHKFTVLMKANELCVYTIQICMNPNVFLPEYQNALTNDIIRTAKNIFICGWKANDIRVDAYDDYLTRVNYQNMAISACAELLAMMQVAQKLFHLETRRIKYWGEKTIDVRDRLRAWRESDKRRYMKYQ